MTANAQSPLLSYSEEKLIERFPGNASFPNPWMAFDLYGTDATQENGCLWVHPGGHRIPVKSRYRMTPDLTEARMETLNPEPYSTDDLVPLEADAGTLVLLHGTLPHWSAPNTSSRSRHAFTLHVIDGVADYPADNWLRRPPELPLRGFA